MKIVIKYVKMDINGYFSGLIAKIYLVMACCTKLTFKDEKQFSEISATKSDLNRFCLIILMLFMIGKSGHAANYYSNPVGNAGNFSANAVWSTTPGGSTVNFPGTTHTFYITTGDNITLSAAQTAGAIIVESGGTLTNGGTFILTCAQVTIDNGGTLVLTTTQPTFSGSITNNGAITGTTARLTANAGTFTNTGTITLGAGRISRTTGPLTNSGSIILNVTGGRFTATTGSFTNTATGTLAITGAATVTLGTGNFVNDNSAAGSVNFGSSAVALIGTAQSIGSFTTTGAVTATNTSGTIAVAGDINGLTFTKSSTGTINMGSGTHTFTGIFALGTTGSVDGGSSTINLNVGGSAWTGTGTVFTAASSTVNFGGTAQTIAAGQTFYNLTLSNSGVKTLNTTIINNILSMEGSATVLAAPTYGASATLRYNGTANRAAGLEWLATFAATGGVIIDNVGDITTNGNKVFSLNVPMTINSGAVLIPAANTFSFGGDLINAGTWTASTGAVTITLARASQSIGSFETTGLVTMSKASGTATFTGDINGGAFIMNGAGIINLGAGLTHTFTGTWTNTAGTLQGNTSTMNIGGTGSGTGVTFTAGTSTVNFNGAGLQDIPAFTYNNLTTSTGNSKTLLGNTEVTKVLTINASTTLNVGANTLNLSGNGNPLVVGGTFTKGTSTVSFANATSTNIPALNYYNLNLTGGERVFANSGIIDIEAVFTPGAGIFTVTGSTVELSGGAQTIPEFTFNDLVLSGSGAKSILNATTVSANTIEIQNGPTLNLVGTGILNITKP